LGTRPAGGQLPDGHLPNRSALPPSPSCACKRVSLGLAVQAYYEFSKQLDDHSGGVQVYFNRRNDCSLTTCNRRRRLTLRSTFWASGDPIELRPQVNNAGGDHPGPHRVPLGLRFSF
jgi:hypothetical protein